MRPQSSMGFGENICKLKNSDKAAFKTLVEARAMLAPTSKRPYERVFAVDSGASMHKMSKKRVKLRGIGHFAKVENPYCGAYTQWRSAYKRGGTCFRSRFKPICHCAITRGNAYSLIAWKTLRRPRYSFEWVSGQKTTVDQRREDNFMQNGQLRNSFHSRVFIQQFWEQFVFYIATAGLIEFIFNSSSRAK